MFPDIYATLCQLYILLEFIMKVLKDAWRLVQMSFKTDEKIKTEIHCRHTKKQRGDLFSSIYSLIIRTRSQAYFMIFIISPRRT